MTTNLVGKRPDNIWKNMMIDNIQSVPVNIPLLDGREEAWLLEAIRTGWISSEGPFVQQFEEQFSGKIGRKFGIAVSSGTAALDIAVRALGIGPGDEVILPSFTIISCAAAVVRAGAKPVFVDACPDTWNMDVAQIEAQITSKTKAIMPVHIYGLPVDMDPLCELAERYKLKIIEDAAEAHGLQYKARNCGTFGDLSIFSFYPNKLITTGEGGMILTDDEDLAERCKSLRNLCFQPQRRFIHEELGFNYRMTNLQAAVGLGQLERWDQFIERKQKMGKRYTELLSGVKGMQIPLAETPYAQNVYWVYGIVLDESVGMDACAAMEKLKGFKIGTRPFFWPMHEQPVFREMGIIDDRASFPVAERLARRGFYIPSGLGLTEQKVIYVADKVKEILDC